MSNKRKKFFNILQEFSIPLMVGVFVALVYANLYPDTYHFLVDHELIAHKHWSSLHFIINDIFMVFFFGIATKEIVDSFLPGGALNPVKKAINPLLGTLGGVLGPVLVFFFLTSTLSVPHLNKGWGIPTATDIALAWLAAKIIFGASHPAINFLLLLAIVDDAIGLGIIAIFYGNPDHPVEPMYLALVAFAMLLAFLLRKLKTQQWTLYVFIPGTISWFGLYLAHLHPSLALVFIVPFLPAGKTDIGFFVAETEEAYDKHSHSPLEAFEHFFSFIVNFGLFFFAFANAGVVFSSVGTITWIILASLIIGKTIGIVGFSLLGIGLGFSLPIGMKIQHLLVSAIIAGIGFTVALFVSGEAYNGATLIYQGPAKMGALFSILGFVIAWVVAKMLRVKKAKF